MAKIVKKIFNGCDLIATKETKFENNMRARFAWLALFGDNSIKGEIVRQAEKKFTVKDGAFNIEYSLLI